MTGFAKLSNIKLSAEAEYDMVSEPCNTTKPSNMLDSISVAILAHSAGFIFEESMGSSKIGFLFRSQAV
jgi:hypothetical protein